MKFLHTSDWHVGRTIRSRSRSDEHRAVFAEIISIATQEQVDAVLVTGDIFHERRPPLAAQELVAETLAQLAGLRIPCIVIPGNHDDPGLLRTLKPLGDLVQVHIVSEMGEDVDSLIVAVPARDGNGGNAQVKEQALVGCLPYLHPHLVLSAAEGAGSSENERLSVYQSKLQDFFRALEERIKQRDRHAIALMLAHADIQGSEFGGGEWRSNVVSLNGAILPAHVQYVALGHIHKPQAVPGARAQARYAGSILQMDFGEREQDKSVCLIEAHPGKPAVVSQIPLTKGRRLLRRSGTAEDILAQADDFVDAWVEVVLQLDKRTLELIDQVRALPGVIVVRVAEPQDLGDRHGDPAIRGPGERPAAELFSEYYKTKRKTDPDPQLLALFERLYQEASTAGDEV